RAGQAGVVLCRTRRFNDFQPGLLRNLLRQIRRARKLAEILKRLQAVPPEQHLERGQVSSLLESKHERLVVGIRNACRPVVHGHAVAPTAAYRRKPTLRTRRRERWAG